MWPTPFQRKAGAVDTSLFQIIAEAWTLAQLEGLGAAETREAVQSALMTRDPTLRPGMARIIADQLFPLVERTLGH